MIVRQFLLPSKLWKLCATALLICGFNAGGANAQSLEAFYKGKILTIVEWSIPGSGLRYLCPVACAFHPEVCSGAPRGAGEEHAWCGRFGGSAQFIRSCAKGWDHHW